MKMAGKTVWALLRDIAELLIQIPILLVEALAIAIWLAVETVIFVLLMVFLPNHVIHIAAESLESSYDEDKTGLIMKGISILIVGLCTRSLLLTVIISLFLSGICTWFAERITDTISAVVNISGFFDRLFDLLSDMLSVELLHRFLCWIDDKNCFVLFYHTLRIRESRVRKSRTGKRCIRIKHKRRRNRWRRPRVTVSKNSCGLMEDRMLRWRY
jgi:hypothetical protein